MLIYMSMIALHVHVHVYIHVHGVVVLCCFACHMSYHSSHVMSYI